MADKFKPWPALVEEIRTQHNGVMSVELYFGHDGHHVCKFRNYEKQLAEGDSGVSMQLAVERCIAEWLLELKAQNFAKNPELAEGKAQ
jgi:hypothetical protein